MKRSFLFFALCAGIFTAKAQTTPPANTPTPTKGSSFQDSVRAEQAVAKTVMINGAPMNTAMDFIENLTRSKSFTTFLAAARAGNMVGTFKSRGPLTLFVPPDSIFKKQLGYRYDTLMAPNHKYDLINLLSYHAVAGKFYAKDLAKLIKQGNGEASLLTLSGSKLTARMDANRNITLYDETGGQSTVAQINIEQSNGLIHTVTRVLIPKNKAL